MLKAFMDESGTHAGATVLSIGGYVAREDQWNAFDDELADRTQRRLLTIANRHSVASAGMSVDRVAYDRILTDTMKERVRGPYGIALKGCLASLKALSKRMKLSERIVVVFDSGAPQAGAIESETIKAIRENEEESRYLSVHFEKRHHIPAKQAADIVASPGCPTATPPAPIPLG